jgi:hypothetical protein
MFNDQVRLGGSAGGTTPMANNELAWRIGNQKRNKT